MNQRPLPAPEIIPPRNSLPLLLSIPHSGRAYPGWLVRDSIGGVAALEALEDPLIDRLAWRALASGVGAVIARAPRAAIDCNRAPDEIDPGGATDGRGARFGRGRSRDRSARAGRSARERR